MAIQYAVSRYERQVVPISKVDEFLKGFEFNHGLYKGTKIVAVLQSSAQYVFFLEITEFR